MAGEVASYLRRDGLSARTVTTKLRYADFSIRSRSTSLSVPIDDPAGKFRNPFLNEFVPLAQRIAFAGCVNSVSRPSTRRR